jgi:YidC/Oxa1 family membrane protein insertase
VTLPRPRREALVLGLGFLLVMLVVAACSPNVVPGGSAAPVSPTPHPPLVPASIGIDPFSLLAWALNPLFQVLYVALVWFQKLTGDVGIAIVILTLIIRTLLIPLFRRQIVSMRRTQLIQPELKELQRRYKGDRNKLAQAQMELYKERGVSPASGCLPLLLQLPLLMIIYTVISQGLTNPDPHAMFVLFGAKLVDYQCVNGVGVAGATVDMFKPCIDTTVAWLGDKDISQPWVLFPSIPFLSWFSILAAISAVLQLVQSRMTMPPSTNDYNDQGSKLQRQMVLLLPLLSFVYGAFLPAGLFIYWIVTTLFGIAQQYLIVGWGSMFPLLGWNPSFARDHAPRFPVEMPSLGSNPAGTKRGSTSSSTMPTERTEAQRAKSAAATVRPRERGRQGRRGRKR